MLQNTDGSGGVQSYTSVRISYLVMEAGSSAAMLGSDDIVFEAGKVWTDQVSCFVLGGVCFELTA